ncbi:MAG: hypothetical protein LBT35_01330 [Tannerella sp.]|jgi:hypothetical protein|nr:hypothetical protein [Tannerella sp.]
MKKFFFSMLFSIICLTSCLEGSNETSGQAIGVFSAYGGKNFNPVFISSIGNVYSASMNTIMEDARCYFISYKYQGDLPENSAAMVMANGYSTVTLMECEEIDNYPFTPYRSDTSTVLPDETPLISGYAQNGISYVPGYLFLQHSALQAPDARLDWELSYDYSTTPTVESGLRYYDVFLRATVKIEGTKSAVETSYLNAYHVGNFLTDAANSEKSRLENTGAYNPNSSTFTLRINYVSEINDTEITWKRSSVDLSVYSFSLTSEGY